MDTPATCDALAPVPDTVQVAWVSKLGKRAGSRTVRAEGSPFSALRGRRPGFGMFSV